MNSDKECKISKFNILIFPIISCISKCQNKPTTKSLKSDKASALKRVSLPTWPNLKSSVLSSSKSSLIPDYKAPKKKLVTCFTRLPLNSLKPSLTTDPFSPNMSEVEPFPTPVNLISPSNTWKTKNFKVEPTYSNSKKTAVSASNSRNNKSKKSSKKTLPTPIQSLSKFNSSWKSRKSSPSLKAKPSKISLMKPGNLKDSLKK